MEKYLKARLSEAELPIPKTHDLEDLVKRLKSVEPLWLPYQIELGRVTEYAVTTRYPGASAGSKAAARSFKICEQVRSLARASLGLKHKH